jgi:probable HAF family extracellular repeat protein
MRTFSAFTLLQVVAFASCSTLTQVSQGQSYTVTHLGTLGGSHSAAYGINNSGAVVGYASLSGSKNHAFIWSSGTGMVDIDDPANMESGASKINDAGQVVGRTHSTDAFIWSSSTGMQVLPNLGISMGASGVNNLGQVVGEYMVNDTIFRGYVWDTLNGIQDIGTLGGPRARATGINNLGQVTGMSGPSLSVSRSILWAQGTGMQDLGTIGGEGSLGQDINDAGQIVGIDVLPGQIERGFIWTSSSGMQHLDNLGYLHTEPTAINNFGQAVGILFQPNPSVLRAFIWSEYGGTQDLNDLITPGSGWTLTHAYDINDAGQIVGYGAFNGRQRAFLLTPNAAVPEPGIWTLLLSFGTGGAVIFRRNKGHSRLRSHKKEAAPMAGRPRSHTK